MGDQEITNSIRYEKVIKRLRRKMRRYVDPGPTPGAAMSIVTSKGPYGQRALDIAISLHAC